MPETARRTASYDDLYAILENATGEIISGELIVTPYGHNIQLGLAKDVCRLTAWRSCSGRVGWVTRARNPGSMRSVS
ncbi:MAG: hypothetical protein AB1634_06405, partial [Thermodesulfobacteriota bacterium]